MPIRFKNKIQILFFIFCFSLCSFKDVYAFGQPNGEITINVNLRQTPSLNGVIITGLKKNERVVIEDNQEDWYQVVVERETYGFKGWVYGKYIKKDKVEEALPVVAMNDTPDNIKQEKLSEKATEPAAVEKKITVEQKPAEPEVTPEIRIDDEAMMFFERQEENYTEKNLFKDNTLKVTPINTGDGQDKDFIIKIFLKILSPVLACIAILFSHRALRMTKKLREKVNNL